MMRSIRVLRAATLSAVVMSGCGEDISSEDLRTSGMYGWFQVAASGGGATTVTAQIKAGGAQSNTYVELEGGDELRVAIPDETRVMSKRESAGGGVSYSTNFETDAEDTQFHISLVRPVESESAPDTFVSLPAPMEIVGPTQGATISRQDSDITLAWENSGRDDRMFYEIGGECIYQESAEITLDNGAVIIPRGTLRVLESHTLNNCDVTIALKRARLGTVDPNLGEGGTVNAIQTRTVKILSSP